MTTLFDPVRLGELHLANRIVMAPLTRNRAAPGQVAVYLDGVPLTSAAHGVVSLGDLPGTAIERAAIYRGLGPLSLGVATPGGAVNLVTASAPGLREVLRCRVEPDLHHLLGGPGRQQ